jgi:DNA-binding transcriptional LysR family regulator
MRDHAPSINQFRLFDALYQLRSLNKAARSLGIPQSTLSRWLGELRQHFNDPLFVRTESGLEPTPRASEAAAAISEIASIYQQCVKRAAGFDASRSRRDFRIASSDFGHSLFLPRIYNAVAKCAPGISLTAVPLGRKQLIQQLESGDVDIAIGEFPTLHAGVREEILFTTPYACVLRRDHPSLRSSFDLGAFKACTHVIVAAHEFSHVHERVEAQLQRICPEERIRVSCESFLVSALLAEETDLVLTAPAPLCNWITQRDRLVSVPVPFSLPEIAVKQYWHSRFEADTGIIWLRRQITAVAH